jgi:hypothetical protein
MSGLGHSRRFGHVRDMSAYPLTTVNWCAAVKRRNVPQADVDRIRLRVAHPATCWSAVKHIRLVHRYRAGFSPSGDGLILTWAADLEGTGDQADRWLGTPADPHIAATMNPGWDNGSLGGARDRPTVRSESYRQS